MTDADWRIGGNPRMPGYAIDYDGSNDRFDMGTPNGLNNQEPFTLVCWMRMDTAPAAISYLFAKRNSGAGSGTWWVRVEGTLGIAFSRATLSTDVKRLTDNNSFNLNQWHHILTTWDGTNQFAGIHIYVDGKEASYQTDQNSTNAIESDAAFNFAVGNVADGDADQTFNGMIAESRFYGKRIFSPAEVWEDYQNPLGTFRLRSSVVTKPPVIIAGFKIHLSLLGVGA